VDYASSLLGLLPGAKRTTPGVKELLAKVATYLPSEQVERVRTAAEFGAAAARIIKAQRSVDRTSRSASGGNLSGKKTHPDTDQGASG